MSSRPDWAIEGLGWPNRDHSRFVETGGMRWHVQVKGDGPILLLIHGTGAATHSWRDLMPLLAADFTVVAPDLPGHGFSARGPQTLPAIAKTVGQLVTTLNLAPALIVGHSAGAAIAIRMALDGVPVRGIMALNPALLPFPGLAAQLFPTLAKMLFLNPFAPHIFARMAGPTREVARFMLKSTGSTLHNDGIEFYARLFRKPAHIAGTIGMMANWDLETLKRELPGLNVPLRMIHGAKDTAIPVAKAREAATLIPGAQLEVLDGLGHLAHEEGPARIAAMIAAFAKEMALLSKNMAV
jgi:magnesium chelatase accessory protein